jgi:hypothetical protein
VIQTPAILPKLTPFAETDQMSAKIEPMVSLVGNGLFDVRDGRDGMGRSLAF